MRAKSVETRVRMASICSRGVMPSAVGVVTRPAIWLLIPATRTWKNSSRFWATIATKRNRSSKGSSGSSAIASTRSWKARSESSRLIKCSGWVIGAIVNDVSGVRHGSLQPAHVYAALMPRGLVSVTALALALTACGGGAAAPAVGELATACGVNFCVGYPGGWEVVEAGEDFLSLRHPAAPQEAVATVGQVNMEGVLRASGNEWPRPTDAVVESFWDLIDGGGAELATLDPRRDGSVGSFGSFSGGRLWYLLAPIEGRRAIGVEVRGPNSSWSTHAEAIMDSLLIVEP